MIKKKQHRIMVVDDESDMVDLIQLILETEGYEVIAATSGKDALARLPQEQPDLVLLDVTMPEMDGWQVLQKIREDEQFANLPIVMVTAKSQSMDRIMGLEILHVNDYVTKPFGRQELVQCVEKQLSTRLAALQ